MKISEPTSPIPILKNTKTQSFWQDQSSLSKNPEQYEKSLQAKLAYEKMKAGRIKTSHQKEKNPEEMITSLRHSEFLGRQTNIMDLFVGLNPSFIPNFDDESVETTSLRKGAKL